MSYFKCVFDPAHVFEDRERWIYHVRKCETAQELMLKNLDAYNTLLRTRPPLDRRQMICTYSRDHVITLDCTTDAEMPGKAYADHLAKCPCKIEKLRESKRRSEKKKQKITIINVRGEGTDKNSNLSKEKPINDKRIIPEKSKGKTQNFEEQSGIWEPSIKKAHIDQDSNTVMVEFDGDKFVLEAETPNLLRNSFQNIVIFSVMELRNIPFFKNKELFNKKTLLTELARCRIIATLGITMVSEGLEGLKALKEALSDGQTIAAVSFEQQSDCQVLLFYRMTALFGQFLNNDFGLLVLKKAEISSENYSFNEYNINIEFNSIQLEKSQETVGGIHKLPPPVINVELAESAMKSPASIPEDSDLYWFDNNAHPIKPNSPACSPWEYSQTDVPPLPSELISVETSLSTLQNLVVKKTSMINQLYESQCTIEDKIQEKDKKILSLQHQITLVKQNIQLQQEELLTKFNEILEELVKTKSCPKFLEAQQFQFTNISQALTQTINHSDSSSQTSEDFTNQIKCIIPTCSNTRTVLHKPCQHLLYCDDCWKFQSLFSPNLCDRCHNQILDSTKLKFTQLSLLQL